MSGNYCEVCAGGGATLVGNEDASQYLCKECANEGRTEAEQPTDDFRDADAYGDDRGGEMGVTFGDD
jgi:ribosome-binding protein aMBF1 (putative translation factor)